MTVLKTSTRLIGHQNVIWEAFQSEALKASRVMLSKYMDWTFLSFNGEVFHASKDKFPKINFPSFPSLLVHFF